MSAYPRSYCSVRLALGEQSTIVCVEAMLSEQANVKRLLFIVGQARTGSSALFWSLTRHPEIIGIGEPFHPRRNGERFIGLVKDASSLCIL